MKRFLKAFSRRLNGAFKGAAIAAIPWPIGGRGDRPARLNTVRLPIANKYREGKVKSTPGGE